MTSRSLRRGVVAAGMGSRSGTSAASVDRGAPLRAGDRRGFDGVEAESVTDSEPSAEADESDESVGEAQAVPTPPTTIPTPKATAKPPTRPTTLDAPNSPTPLIHWHPHSSANAIIADQKP